MKRFQAGRLVQQVHYKSFQPNPINRAWQLDNMELIQLLGQADRELGRLDMHSEYIPDVDLFVRMHVLKEATQSSRIEGFESLPHRGGAPCKARRGAGSHLGASKLGRRPRTLRSLRESGWKSADVVCP